MKTIYRAASVAALSIIATAALFAQSPSKASSESGEGWITLFDGQNLDNWDKVGETNWRLEDGAVVADNRTSEKPAYLVSKQSYEDFVLHVEFWASDDANSGIFMRCINPTKINDRMCYEANIYDQRKDPTYSTGAIVRHVEVESPEPKAGGQWNTYHITMKGRDIKVVFNGVETATLRSGLVHRWAFRASAWGWYDKVSQGFDQTALGLDPKTEQGRGVVAPRPSFFDLLNKSIFGQGAFS